LPSYHRSIRKRQKTSPKFYLFDLGIKRALENALTIPLQPATYVYGNAFEHFIVCEAFRLNEYFRKDFSFSYLRSTESSEIDLIIDRPGKPTLLIEIKSKKQIYDEDVSVLKRFQTDWKGACEAQLWCTCDEMFKIHQVHVLPWKDALAKLFS